MSRRGGQQHPPIPDLHLWDKVARTVLPLRPRRRVARAEMALPLPPGAAPPPQRPKFFARPAYQSAGAPGAAPPPGAIEPRLRKRLGRGRIDIDGTLDLHGLRQDEARAALARFVAARHARGDRTLLVITGKGLKKLDGDAATIIERGVLRTMLPIWLSAPDLMPLVAGWDQAAPGHGGAGAWYVRLRREAAR